MTRDPRLATSARDFATKLKRLLNCTVCVGAQVGSLIAPDGRAVVGTKLDKVGLDSRPVRLMTAKGAEMCWLDVSYRLYLDPRGYLTCHSSTYSIYVGRDADAELFHFDYERDKSAYTEAHLQVEGDNEALRRLMASLDRPKRTLRNIHFPVGGRRFRPSLEDVLEFLINEGMVEPADGWKGVLDRSREEFREKQLKAAIARNPDAAVEVLIELGYTVKPPKEARAGGKVVPFRNRGSKR